MATIRQDIVVDAAPAAVWAAVRDVGEAHRRLFPGVLSDAHLDGDARVVTFVDGTVLRELIVAIDDDLRRFAYASVGGRARHHNASLQVLDEGERASRVVWITDVLPDEFAPMVRGLMEKGSAVLKRTLEADADH